MSDPWYQLGKLELLFCNWEEAIDALEKARAYHSEDSWAYLNTSIWMLYAHIYRKDIPKADEIISKIEPELEARVFQRSPIINGIFGYLKSCLLFVKQEFQAAWVTLQEVQELSFDKEGWITGIKLFEIMIMIEKGEPDIAGQKLENLRKHLARHNTEPRMKTIYKLLNAQERQSFCFEEVKGEAEWIQELVEEHKWDPAGYEVIRFDEWYQSRRKTI
jgi:tetratricopeptide (TPR) repeat protein